MSTSLFGLLLDSEQSGTLSSCTQLTKLRVSATPALVGTLTISDKTGTIYTSPGSFAGAAVIAADAWGPVYFALTNPTDLGKVSVSWSHR